MEISQYFHQILSQGPFRSRPKRRLLSSGILHCSSAGHASFQLTPGKKRGGGGGGALPREPPRRGVSESSDTIERVLQPFKVTIINFLVLYLLFLSCVLCYQEFILSNYPKNVILSFTFSVILVLLSFDFFLCRILFPFLHLFHCILCTLCFSTLHCSACAGRACQDGLPSLGMTPQPQENWSIPLSLDVPFLYRIQAPSSALDSRCPS